MKEPKLNQNGYDLRKEKSTKIKNSNLFEPTYAILMIVF